MVSKYLISKCKKCGCDQRVRIISVRRNHPVSIPTTQMELEEVMEYE